MTGGALACQIGGGRMSEERVKVWDWPVRLFHWAIVALVLFQFLTAEFSELDWHVRGGCTVLALLLFRLVWGIVGSDTARFAGFVRGPGEAMRHLARFRDPNEARVLGHTASGGWAVIIMILLLCGQVATGLFADDDIATTGPLGGFVSKATRRTLTSVHASLFWALVAMIAVHVVAIGAYRVLKRQDLIGPMISGWAPALRGVAAPKLRPWWVALVVLALCGVAAWRVYTLGDYL